jgi:hypothetical protein
MTSYSKDSRIATFINKSPKLKLAIQHAEEEGKSKQTEEGNQSKTIENPHNEPVSVQISEFQLTSILEDAKPLSDEEIAAMVKEAQNKMVGYGKFAFKTREKAQELGHEFLELNNYQTPISKIFESIAKDGKEAALSRWKPKAKKASKSKAKPIEQVAYSFSYPKSSSNREPYSLRSGNDNDSDQNISSSKSFVPIDLLPTTNSSTRNDKQTIEAETLTDNSLTRKRSLSPPTASPMKNVRQRHSSIDTDNVHDLSLDDEGKEEENVVQNKVDLIETPTMNQPKDFSLMEWGYLFKSSIHFDKSWVLQGNSNYITKLIETSNNIGGKQCAACFDSVTYECDQPTEYSFRCYHPLCYGRKLYFCKTHYLHEFDSHHITFSVYNEIKNP